MFGGLRPRGAAAAPQHRYECSISRTGGLKCPCDHRHLTRSLPYGWPQVCLEGLRFIGYHDPNDRTLGFNEEYHEYDPRMLAQSREMLESHAEPCHSHDHHEVRAPACCGAPTNMLGRAPACRFC